MAQSILVYLTHPHVDAWNFKPRHREILQEKVQDLEIHICHHSREFLEHLPQSQAAVVWYFKKEWLEKAPRLEWIATPAAGTDWIECAPGDWVKVLFGGFHGPMIAESVLGAIFYFCKAFELSRKAQQQRKWARVKISQQIQSLYRSRVTILGFGKIGQAIGRAIKPFGCRITGVRRSPGGTPDYFEEGDQVVTPSRFPEVLKETDHFILVLPGGPETSGLIGPEHFRMLPSTCYLYNVGRGNVYKERHLAEALAHREIAGAYLDVFESEPLPEDSPLWIQDNVLIQPHLSAASPQYLDLFAEELAARLLSGAGL